MARIALHALEPSCRLALVRAFETAPSGWDVFLWDGTAPFDIRVTDAPVSDTDIVFDVDDPEASVERVADALNSKVPRTTVVTGARRGTGVTTLALHLGAAVPGMDVALLDLDDRSSLRARLGLPDDARDWRAAGGLPYSAGFRIFLAPSDGDGDAASALRDASKRADHLIVDAPAGPWRDYALKSCSSAILVVPPSHQGIADARRILHQHPEVRWTCVVVRVGAGGELTARHVARDLGHPVAVEFPCSPFLRDREDDHRLLTERWSRYFRRTMRLAASIG